MFTLNGVEFAYELSGCDIQDRQRRFGLRCHQTKPVDHQEQAYGQKCSPLVPIDKGMVFSESDTIRGRQTCHVRLLVQRRIQRTRQRGVQKLFVSQATGTAVFG